MRVRLHPSLSIITSSYPIYSIWRINRDPVRFTPPQPWAAEAVLVARPRLKVRTQRITDGDVAFIRALAVGSTLGEAVLAAQQAVPQFRASESLAVMIGAHVVIGFGDTPWLSHAGSVFEKIKWPGKLGHFRAYEAMEISGPRSN